jgi:molybdopterin-binding protein
MVTGGTTVKISARNTWKGTVKSVEHGAVNSEVTIELSNGLVIVSIITKDSAERLGLATGKEAYAIVKASDVMVGTN